MMKHISEQDLAMIRKEFARSGGLAKQAKLTQEERTEAALKMVRAKAEKRARKEQEEQQ